MAQSRRDHLIETALELFDGAGYHATGIDRILAEAGVAKMTLYKHFKSKNELILEALTRQDERWLAWFREAVERHARNDADADADPRARLRAVFHALDDWLQTPGFNGCLFCKAASEFPDRTDPIHAAAARHHRSILAFLKDLARDAGARRPARLARELLLLMEGAISVTQVNGQVGATRAAARAAEILIEEALRPEG